MEKMIRKLYCNMVQELDPADVLSREMREEILGLLKEEEQLLDRQEYERYRDMAFLVASAAEEYGFERGFQYAFQQYIESQFKVREACL